MRGNGVEHTTTGGTGNLTLSAVSGKPSYADVFGTSGSRIVEYAVIDSSGVCVETGSGEVALSTLILTRKAIETTWNGTSYVKVAPSALNIASGSKVICAPTAASFGLVSPGRSDTTHGLNYVQPWGGVPFGSAVWQTGSSVPASTVIFVPALWNSRVAVTRMWFLVNTAQTSAAARCAIYDIDPSTKLPANLLHETAEMSCATATQVFGTLNGGSAVWLPPGWYFVGVMSNSVASWNMKMPISPQTMPGEVGLINSNPAGGNGSLTKSITYNTFATAVGNNPSGLAWSSSNGISANLATG